MSVVVIARSDPSRGRACLLPLTVRVFIRAYCERVHSRAPRFSIWQVEASPADTVLSLSPLAAIRVV